MIQSIEFLGNTEGYLLKKQYDEVLREGISNETWENLSVYDRRRHARKYVKNVYRGYQNKLAKNSLVKHKFEFSPDKINVLFGPNGCGKTTIIRNIAHHALCGTHPNIDGWTNLFHYNGMNIDRKFRFEDSYDERINVPAAILLDSGNNSANINWDGAPVFFHDLENMKQHGLIGDLIGGTFKNLYEETNYHLNKNSMSRGQMSSYIFRILAERMRHKPTISSIRDDFDDYMSRAPINDFWIASYNAQRKYYDDIVGDTLPDMELQTFMMDEIDKSLDIQNVYILYTEVLPILQKEFNVQIIMVSHSPLILSNAIYDNPEYNVISLDKKYTKETRNKLKGVHF